MQSIKRAEKGSYQAALDAAVPEQWMGCLTAESFKKKGEGVYCVRFRNWDEFTVSSDQELTHDQLVHRCRVWGWVIA